MLLPSTLSIFATSLAERQDPFGLDIFFAGFVIFASSAFQDRRSHCVFDNASFPDTEYYQKYSYV